MVTEKHLKKKIIRSTLVSFQVSCTMSTGSCSGPGVCGGARRRPPPPPEPALSLAADLSELSLDQGYHTLADCGPPSRRRRDNTLTDALWLKILSYLEVISYFYAPGILARMFNQLTIANTIVMAGFALFLNLGEFISVQVFS